MATLALAAATAEAHVAAQITAVIIGTVVDQRFVHPLIFKGDEPEPPRLNDMAVQQSSPGAPIPRVFGRSLGRTAGIVIWRGPASYTSQSTGGKGGTEVSYLVKQDVAVLISFNGTTPVDIEQLNRVWANGKLVYEKGRTLDETSVSKSEFISTADNFGNRNYGIIKTDADMTKLSIEDGDRLTVSGTGSANDGDFIPWELKETSSGNWKIYVRTDDGRNIVDADYGGGTRFQQNSPDLLPGTADAIRLHKGTQTTPDAAVEAIEGEDDACVWQGFAYVVFDGLNLSRWGNRMPSFEFEFQPPSEFDMPSEALSEILKSGGLDASEIDVSLVSDTEAQQFEFYIVRGAQSAASAVEPILLHGWIYAWEQGGKVHLAGRGSLPELIVPTAKLGAHVDGESIPPAIDFDEPAELVIPNRGEATFQDEGADGLDGHVHYGARATRGYDIERTISVRIPLTTTADKARGVVKRLVLQAHGDRRLLKLPVPYSVGRVHPGMRLKTTSPSGIAVDVLVTRVSRGRNGIVQVEGRHVVSIDQDFELAAEPS